MKQLVRVLGLVVFMASLALLAWWWTVVAGRSDAAGGPTAAAIDALLFSAFALHHSVLARPWAKRRVQRVLPDDLVRTSYVWIGSLLLIAVCMFWRPVGGMVYHASGFPGVLLRMVQVLGVVVGALAVRRISVRELA